MIFVHRSATRQEFLLSSRINTGYREKEDYVEEKGDDGRGQKKKGR